VRALAGRGASIVSVTPADIAMGGDGGSIACVATAGLGASTLDGGGTASGGWFACVEASAWLATGLGLPASPLPQPAIIETLDMAIRIRNRFIDFPLSLPAFIVGHGDKRLWQSRERKCISHRVFHEISQHFHEK
jgi:hypothetical protein